MKAHLRLNHNHPLIAACGHNARAGAGVAPLICYRPKEFFYAQDKCKHCEKLFKEKRLAQLKEKEIA